MRRILVPLDGTVPAESALPLARLLARRAAAELVLAHVVEPTVPAESLAAGSISGVVPILPDQRTLHELRRSGQDYLDGVLARTRAALRVVATERRAPDAQTATPSAAARWTGAGCEDEGVRGVLVDGDPATALHAAALDLEADLVVMASQGRRRLTRLVLGSVSEDVVRAGGVSVLVVPRGNMMPGDELPPSASATAREAPIPRHLLIALDGSPESESILGPAVALARLLGSGVTLGMVRDVGRPDRVTLLPTSILDTTASGGRAGAPVPAESSPGGSGMAGGRGFDESAYLDHIARRLASAGCTAATEVLDGHPVVDRLLACTDELGVDWFALASQGQGAWSRLVEGSVAEALMQRAPVPVLLLHPR